MEEQFKASSEPVMKDLQILRTGSFSDPRYGKFPITKKMLDEMVKNFDDGVRGIVPALDYGHDTGGRAAGWIKKLSVKPDGKEFQLWGSFEMTPGGQASLADKDYAYLSADFDDKYVDNEEGKKYGCVLLGAALTNRPVVKKMVPATQLSEDPAIGKKIADLISKGHDPKQAEAIALELQRTGKLTEGENKVDENLSEETKKKLADHEKMCADMSALHGALGAKDHTDAMSKVAAMKGGTPAPAAPTDEDKKMSETLTKTQKELSEIKTQLAEEKKVAAFNKMLTEGKAVEAQREHYMSGDMAKFAAAFVPIKLSETGHPIVPADVNDDVEEQIRVEAKKLCDAAKAKGETLSLKDAYSKVLSENKTLAEARRKQQE